MNSQARNSTIFWMLAPIFFRNSAIASMAFMTPTATARHTCVTPLMMVVPMIETERTTSPTAAVLTTAKRLAEAIASAICTLPYRGTAPEAACIRSLRSSASKQTSAVALVVVLTAWLSTVLPSSTRASENCPALVPAF